MVTLSSYIKSVVLFLFFGCFTVLNTFAHEIVATGKVNLNDLTKDAKYTMRDPNWNMTPMSANEPACVSKRNVLLSLVYNRSLHSDTKDKNWAFRVFYRLVEYPMLGELAVDTLTIGAWSGGVGGNGGIYQATEKYELSGYGAEVEIMGLYYSNDITSTSETDWQEWNLSNTNIPEDIHLELSIESEEYFGLKPFPSDFEIGNNDLDANKNLTIYWKYLTGAEEYELEWAYWDFENTNKTPNNAEIFKKAARIELSDNYFSLPLTYPKGTIYYRVRAVGRYLGMAVAGDYGHRRYGDWCPTQAFELTDDFQNQMHWQASTVFAEEGKYKKVVTYADDGLRVRQVQTNLSTERTTILSTQHYDVEGRATVQVLPAPYIQNASYNNNLFFKADFNQDFDYEAFDREKPLAMKKAAKGTAQYYSDLNPAGGIYKSWIADAEGFPYSVMRYLNDGTGRVRAQTGLGSKYQLGSGRETQYFYDDASSTQLHRLFGGNVGKAKYYKRNVVKDPNGQFSVAYVDLAGRTIATALAGASPDNVTALDSETSGTLDLVENLIENNILEDGGKLSITRAQLMNVQDTHYDFHYEFTKDALNIPEENICIGCTYELTIQIFDPCGEEIAVDLGNGTNSETFSGEDLCGSSTTNLPILKDFSIDFCQIGVYTIVKTLKVVEPSLEKLRLIVEATEDYQAFYDEILAEITIDCEPTCVEYATNYFNQENPNLDPSSSAYTTALAAFLEENCSDYEDFEFLAKTNCSSIYNLMQEQMAFGGCKVANPPYDLALWTEYKRRQEAGEDLTSLQVAYDANEVILESHPDYCHYEICGELEQSVFFDFVLASCNSWQDIVTNFNTGGASVTNAAEALALLQSIDPFICPQPLPSVLTRPYVFSDACPTSNSKSYLTNEINAYSGLVDLITSFNTIISANSDINFTEGLKTKLLIGMYLAAKHKAIFKYKKVVKGCLISSDTDCRAYEGLPFDNLSDQQSIEDYITSLGINEPSFNQCDGAAQAWVHALEVKLDCNLTVESEGDLLTVFKNYCLANDDVQNPLGYILSDDDRYDALKVDVWEAFSASGCTQTLVYNALGEIAVLHSDVYCCAQDENGNDIIVQKMRDEVKHLFDFLSNNILNAPANDPYIKQTSGNIPSISVHETTLILTINWKDGINGCNPYLIKDLTGQKIHPLDIFDFEFLGFDFINQTQTIKFSASYDVDDPSLRREYRLSITSDAVGCIATTSCLIVPCPPGCPPVLTTIYDNIIKEKWNKKIDKKITEVLEQYKCLANTNEAFRVSYPLTEHHYTLYYYDQAGSLVQTVPPVGVMPINIADATMFDANGNWVGGNYQPLHFQKTNYWYNSLGQVTASRTPDAGVSEFKYDFAQRLRVSRNAKQKVDKTYSYTKFDAIGRTIEVGEVVEEDNGVSTGSYAYETVSFDIVNVQKFPEGGRLSEITATFYDESTLGRHNMRNRVSRMLRKADNKWNTKATIESLYSYDVHGNVTSLKHKIPALGQNNFDTEFDVAYDYDLISGKVNELRYQAGKPDQYYHKYEYDADNRLTNVWTSLDNIHWEEDARYFYYLHGPMARMEVGHDKVQGNDYYYTLQGWIKGVNAPLNDALTESLDPGKDGYQTTMAIRENRYIGKDAAAYNLSYYQGDYIPIGGDALLSPGTRANFPDFFTKRASYTCNGVSELDHPLGLFNGNISMMLTDLRGFGNTAPKANVMLYKYDALHRIKSSDSRSYNQSGAIVDHLALDKKYSSTYAYDANGNLDNLTRSWKGELIDNISYNYIPDNGGGIQSNKHLENTLLSASDLVPNTLMKDYGFSGIQNYEYDAIGNLVKNANDGVSAIDWSVYGKVERVVKDNNLLTKYLYDAGDQRLMEKDGIVDGTGEIVNGIEKWYIRDPQGNLLALYQKNISGEDTKLRQKEVPLYGSSRVGMWRDLSRGVDIGQPVTERGLMMEAYKRYRGLKNFEFSNHLGNVLTVVSDQLLGVGGAFAANYDADVISFSDYFPFGMEMPGRNGNSDMYRYGFNGKEKDEEGEFGSATHYDYGFRIYNPAVGRFLSVDPLSPDYPWYTPYQFAGNMPIWAVDLDGLEPEKMFNFEKGKGYVVLVSVDKNYTNELTKALSEKNILVGENVIQNPSSPLGIYVVEKQYYQGHSVHSPNVHGKLIGYMRFPMKAVAQIPSPSISFMENPPPPRINVLIPRINPIKFSSTEIEDDTFAEKKRNSTKKPTHFSPNNNPPNNNPPKYNFETFKMKGKLGLNYESGVKDWFYKVDNVGQNSLFDLSVKLKSNPESIVQITMNAGHTGNWVFSEKWSDEFKLGLSYEEAYQKQAKYIRYKLGALGVSQNQINIQRGGLKTPTSTDFIIQTPKD